MRFSLISLTVLGIAAVGLFALKSRPQVDLSAMTGSLTPVQGAQSNRSAPQTSQPPAAFAAKTERIVAQLVPPGKVSDPKAGRSSLIIAQAPPATQPEPQNLAPQNLAPQNLAAQNLAQQNPAPRLSPATPSDNPQPIMSAAAPPAGDQPAVDESALRYFAARGDTARLQAEISRLKALYPNWTPPADPLASPVTQDRQLEAMWQLYAQSRYAEVRKAIADRQAAEPGWQPPADLLDRLKLAEARAGLVTASDAKNYDAVIRAAAENPTLLTCSEVDMLWRVADAFARTDKPGRARDAYLYILNNCDNASERYATVQKASEDMPPNMLEDLLAKERTPPGGQPEFEPLRDDIARRLVGDGNDDPKLVVPEKYLMRLERLAESNGMTSDALLLGWYYYRRDNLGGAERWFRAAFSKEDTESAAEGLALTLVARHSPVEAESVLYRWRDASDGAKQAYLAAVANLLALDPPPVLQDEVLRRMAPVVIAARNVEAAQQFGWYARTMQQLQTASDWFLAALTWKPDDEPSAYGLLLTRNDLGDKAGVAQIQRLWAGRSQRIAQLGEPTPAAAANPLPLQPPAQVPAQPQYPSQSYLPAQSMPDQRQPQYQPPQQYRSQVQPQPQPQPLATAPQYQRPAVVARAIPASPTVVPVQAPRRSARVAVVETATQRADCTTTQDPRRMSPDAALARGWCLMNINRPLEAAQSFDAAYLSPSTTTRSDAAYGKSLAYLRAGLTDKASVAAADTAQTNKRAVELQAAILADRAVNAFKLGRYREALLALDQRAQIVPEQADLMTLRAYAHLSLGRQADARRIFQALADRGDKAGLQGLANLDETHGG